MVANLRAFVNEPHPPAQYAGVDRRIALIKPPLGEDERATHAMELLDSVFWVFKGTTHSNWITTSPDEADVIFVHHAEQAQRVENWRNAGKLIAVISTDEAVLPASTYTIVYPFPTVQVLRMLERIENALNVGQSAEPDGFDAARESIDIRGVDAWSFVEALRLLGAVRNPDTWFIGGTPSGPLLSGCKETAAATTATLRQHPRSGGERSI